ncbi:MAG: outer membrane beta-barrel protein [candidate division KSB1 bacterium]|nr:outer membrane beta-barrel protein [candidate division KSB1 bacterium]MDZ7394053.1 outer membrane beta-barrel protein [candidate division KSB1 bacterium]MDZ7414473.1 outer membrane beta-barrel protein [candidate division KSB1 bacterium]
MQKLGFAILVGCLVMTTGAAAQFAVGPHVVVSVPTGSMADELKGGEGIGVKAFYTLRGVPAFSFRGDLDYLSYSSRLVGDFYYYAGSSREEAFRLTLGPQLAVDVGRFRLYAAALGGLYLFQDIVAVTDAWGFVYSQSKTKTRWEWNAGGGAMVDIGLGPWVDVEVRYHSVTNMVSMRGNTTTTESDGQDISVHVGVVFFLR